MSDPANRPASAGAPGPVGAPSSPGLGQPAAGLEQDAGTLSSKWRWSDRRTKAAVGLAVLSVMGGVVIVLGARTDDAYGQAIAVNLGTAMLLAFPLGFVVEHFRGQLSQVAQRVDDVGTTVRHVGERIDALESQADVDAFWRDADRAVDEARTALFGPGRVRAQAVEFPENASVVREALTTGAPYWALDRSVSVALPRPGPTITFWAGPAAVLVDVRWSSDGRRVKREWRNAVSLREFVVDFDAAVRKTPGWESAPKVEWREVFASLASTLDAAFARVVKLGGSARGSGQVMQRPTPHWLITTNGLEHIDSPEKRIGRDEIEARVAPSDSARDRPHADELEMAWAEARARYDVDKPPADRHRTTNA